MKQLLFFLLLTGSTLSAGAQGGLAGTNDLDGIAIAARRMTVSEIMDSVFKNAPKNYLSPDTLYWDMRCSLYNTSDTPFLAQVPICLVLKDSLYQYNLWNPKGVHTIKDKLTTQEQARRIIAFSFMERRNTVKNVQAITAGYKYPEPYLYKVETSPEEDVFYTILVPRKFKSNFAVRLMAAPFKKAQMFSYRSFKIRRRGWVLLQEGYGTYQAPASLVKTFLATKTYRQADSCIAAAKAQPYLRGIVAFEYWKPVENGWVVDQAELTDNLMRFSLMPFTGTTGTEDFTNSYSVVSAPRSTNFDTDSLRMFSNTDIVPFGRLSNFAAMVERKIEKEDKKEAAKKAKKEAAKKKEENQADPALFK